MKNPPVASSQHQMSKTNTFHGLSTTSLLLLGLVACVRSASAEPVAPPPSPEASATPNGASDPNVDIKAVEAEIVGAITVVSPTERTITPRGAELVRAHAPELVTRFRHLAEKRDGIPVGVRLFGIRVDSLASKLGLESGDRVEAIAGRPLDTPEHIASAFEAVKSATTIDLQVSRRGAPLRLVTTVR